jgi:hypothetical protein
MPESLLDECYRSILKIAETQPHDAKGAILALAEMFQDNSGRRSYDREPSQNIHALIVRGYLPTGCHRVRLLDKPPDPGLRASATRDRIFQLRITRNQTLRSCTARMSFPTT